VQSALHSQSCEWTQPCAWVCHNYKKQKNKNKTKKTKQSKNKKNRCSTFSKGLFLEVQRSCLEYYFLATITIDLDNEKVCCLFSHII
jgi:hypothetical protein